VSLSRDSKRRYGFQNPRRFKSPREKRLATIPVSTPRSDISDDPRLAPRATGGAGNLVAPKRETDSFRETRSVSSDEFPRLAKRPPRLDDEPPRRNRARRSSPTPSKPNEPNERRDGSSIPERVRPRRERLERRSAIATTREGVPKKTRPFL
jgi:hypothetical protein